MLLRLAIELPPCDAALRHRAPCRGIHRYRLHQGKINHYPALDAGTSADVVTAATNGDFQSMFTSKFNAGGYVGLVSTSSDECRVFVDQAVVQGTNVVVILVTWLESGPRKLA